MSQRQVELVKQTKTDELLSLLAEKRMVLGELAKFQDNTLSQLKRVGDGKRLVETYKRKDPEKRVNDMQLQADQAMNRLATGETDNVAEVMTAVEQADLAFQLLMQIRNKLVDAHQEIRQMRI